MTDEMKQARQRVFDKVYIHFIIFNQPFGYHPNGKGCVYYTPTGGCAIGVNLSSDEARQECDAIGGSVLSLLDYGRSGRSSRGTLPQELLFLVRDAGSEFLQQIQFCHDVNSAENNKANFSIALKSFAERYNLSIPDSVKVWQQFYFDKAWDHFIVQGKPRAASAIRCLYYTPEGGCAVGINFTSDEVKKAADLRGGNFNSLLAKRHPESLVLADKTGGPDFFTDLQIAHDRPKGYGTADCTPDELKSAFIRVAEKYSLKIPGNAEEPKAS